MSQQKRLNLNIRLQPVEGTALAEVVKWLNEMSASEKNHKISQVLLMNWLPLARAYSGAEPEEIERAYWNYERWQIYQQSIIRDELKIQGSSPNENRLREKMV